LATHQFQSNSDAAIGVKSSSRTVRHLDFLDGQYEMQLHIDGEGQKPPISVPYFVSFQQKTMPHQAVNQGVVATS
ncbi:MAG: hypothetical protein AAFY76_10945, partial [Cyanobacteria bacterium J06649_11]